MTTNNGKINSFKLTAPLSLPKSWSRSNLLSEKILDGKEVFFYKIAQLSGVPDC